MTPTRLQKIVATHLEAWYANPGEGTTNLHQHVGNAITEALAEQDKLWHDGNATLRHERDLSRGQMIAVRAALNCDLHPNISTETVARNLSHHAQECEAKIAELSAQIVDLTFAAKGYQAAAEKVGADQRPQEIMSPLLYH